MIRRVCTESEPRYRLSLKMRDDTTIKYVAAEWRRFGERLHIAVSMRREPPSIKVHLRLSMIEVRKSWI